MARRRTDGGRHTPRRERPRIHTRRAGLYSLAGVVLLVGCADGEASLPPTQGPPDAATLWTVPSDGVDDAVAQLDAIAAEALDSGASPGLAIAVVHRDRIVFASGFGTRDVRTGEPVDADTVFGLGDLSVPLGATVVARAVADGGVSWTDPVARHLPELSLADPATTQAVTIEDLFAQRSGLPADTGVLLETFGYDRQTIATKLTAVPLGPFRTTYDYAPYGVSLAMDAVARAKTTSWATLADGVLFGPVGMERTTAEGRAQIDTNVAARHRWVDDGWVAADPADPTHVGPAATATSTAADLARWMRMVLADGSIDGSRVLPAEAVQQLLTPRLSIAPPSTNAARTASYGLGLGVSVDETGRVRLSHSGDLADGASGAVVLLPAEEIGIVVLSVGQRSGVAEAVAYEFIERVETGESRTDWLAAFAPTALAPPANDSTLPDEPPASGLVTAPLEAYAGSYESPYWGPAEVEVRDGSLWLRIGPDGPPWRLQVWDGDVFAMETTGEAAAGRQPIAFTLGPDGRASAFSSRFLDVGSAATAFVRRSG